MCCDCTHPEALRATGNEKEQVVCVCPWLGTSPSATRGPELLLELLTLPGLLPRQQQQLLMFAEAPPQQDQTVPGPPQSCSPTLWFALPAHPFPTWKATFFGWCRSIHLSLLQRSTCSVSLWKAAQRGSVGSTLGAGAGTTQLPLQLQSSGKAQGSKRLPLW